MSCRCKASQSAYAWSVYASVCGGLTDSPGVLDHGLKLEDGRNRSRGTGSARVDRGVAVERAQAREQHLRVAVPAQQEREKEQEPLTLRPGARRPCLAKRARVGEWGGGRHATDPQPQVMSTNPLATCSTAGSHRYAIRVFPAACDLSSSLPSTGINPGPNEHPSAYALRGAPSQNRAVRGVGMAHPLSRQSGACPSRGQPRLVDQGCGR